MSIEDIRTVDREFSRLMRLGNRARARSKMQGGIQGGIDHNGIIMIKLINAAGAARASDIAEAAGMDPSLVTRQVHQLVEANLVERFADPIDGRATLLRCTTTGLEFFEAHRCAKEAFYVGVFRDWSDHDIATLAHLLDRLNNDIESALQPELANTPQQEK